MSARTRRAAWPVICVGAIAIASLIGTGSAVEAAWPTAIAGTIVGLAWCLTGLAAWGRRPDLRTGVLMLFVGLATTRVDGRQLGRRARLRIRGRGVPSARLTVRTSGSTSRVTGIVAGRHVALRVP